MIARTDRSPLQTKLTCQNGIRGLMLDPGRLTERHDFYFDVAIRTYRKGGAFPGGLDR